MRAARSGDDGTFATCIDFRRAVAERPNPVLPCRPSHQPDSSWPFDNAGELQVQGGPNPPRHEVKATDCVAATVNFK
jgi:hypothetical protein